MADAVFEDRLKTVEIRVAELKATVDARERDLPSRFDRFEARLDRMEAKVDRIPWFILASWLTTILAVVGSLYLRR